MKKLNITVRICFLFMLFLGLADRSALGSPAVCFLKAGTELGESVCDQAVSAFNGMETLVQLDSCSGPSTLSAVYQQNPSAHVEVLAYQIGLTYSSANFTSPSCFPDPNNDFYDSLGLDCPGIDGGTGNPYLFTGQGNITGPGSYYPYVNFSLMDFQFGSISLSEGATSTISIYTGSSGKMTNVYDAAVNEIQGTLYDAKVICVEPPHIMNNETASSWVTANTKMYDVDLTDGGGSSLASFQIRACSTNANCGDLIDWTTVQSGIGGVSFTTNWALPNEVWNALQQGSNYISLRAFDSYGYMSEASVLFTVNIDTTPPDLVTYVNDGPDGDLDETTTLEANWAASADTQSGIQSYWYAIGTAPNATDVVDWTTTASDTFIVRGDLSVSQGQTYYVGAMAQNGAGLFSTPTWSDGQTVFVPFENIWTSAETDESWAAVWGDYDNDGDLDQLVSNEGFPAQPNRVYQNNGGTFSLVWTSTEQESSMDADWGDYDNDGDLDILISGSRIYRNDGGNTFTLVASVASSGQPLETDWGDYDNDGDLDFLSANFGNNNIFRNDGNDTFTLAWTSTESELSWGAELADCDGDGDLDQFIGNNDGPERVYRNDGNSQFTLAWSSPLTEATNEIAVGDTDGDGDPDLLTAGDELFGSPNRLYENIGDCQFTLVWSSTESNQTMDVDLGDFDGDGDLDQLVGNSRTTGEPTMIYRNNGGNTFSLFWSSSDMQKVYSTAWGDSDGDGDLDVLLGIEGANQIYRNNLTISNSAPSTPVLVDRTNALTGTQTFTWSPSSDDHTPMPQLTYQIRIGTCPTCEDIVSGAYTPPSGNVGATTSYSILMPATGTYFWSVRAADSLNQLSPWANHDSFVLTPADDSTPPVFAGLDSAVDAVTGDAVALAWSEATDDSPPITYNIYYKDDQTDYNFATPQYATSSLSIVISGLTQGATYSFIVRAQDNSGNEDQNVIEKTAIPTNPDSSPPVFDGLTSAIDTTDGGRVTLAWSAASDDSPPITYNIFYVTGTEILNYATPQIATTSLGIDITGLLNGTGYQFAVRAQDSLSYEDANTIVLVATPTLRTPSAPGNVLAAATGTAFAISWTAPTTNRDGSTLTDLSGFDVYRGASCQDPNASKLNTTLLDAATLSFTDNSAAQNTVYYYHVTAINSIGSLSEMSQCAMAVDTDKGVSGLIRKLDTSSGTNASSGYPLLGVGGITVSLMKDNTEVATALTSSDGSYLIPAFSADPNATYTVRINVTVESGYLAESGTFNAGVGYRIIKPGFKFTDGILDIGEFRVGTGPSVGDTNCDWVVDIKDMINLKKSYGKNISEEGYANKCDVNGDEVVDIKDFILMKPNYGFEGNVVSPSPCPE